MRLPLWSKVLIGIATCLMVGFISGISTPEAVNGWYQNIEKPGFTPPDWVFAPVWSILYTLMGLAAALVWHQGWERSEVSNAILFFLAQLILNALWPVVFFGMRNPTAALVTIVLLIIVLIVTIVRFFRINRTAGVFLLPYLAWVLFACALNIAIVYLNMGSP